jgi:hypothetical protein
MAPVTFTDRNAYMKALFDRASNLVGWMSDDQKHIYDTAMHWVGYVVEKNAWKSVDRSCEQRKYPRSEGATNCVE